MTAFTSKKIEENPVLNTSILSIVKVEETSVIVLIDGWRMRIYFEKGSNRNLYSVGKQIEVDHYGDIKNPHEVKFQRIN